MAMAFHFHLPIPGRPLIGDICLAPTHRLDALGHHTMQCFHQRTVPHDTLCRKLHALCRSAGLDSRLEPTGCLTAAAADSLCRPDLAVEGVSTGGRILLLDATTADPGAVTMLNHHKSHRAIGAAARAGAARKRTAYRNKYNRSIHEFSPLPIELSGRWGTEFEAFFNKVCGKARDLHGLPPASYGYFVSYWRSRLAISFTKTLARQGLHMKAQLQARLQPTPLSAEPVELSRTF